MMDAQIGWLVREGSFTPAKERIAEVRTHGVRAREDAESVVRAVCDGMTINWPDWLSR